MIPRALATSVALLLVLAGGPSRGEEDPHRQAVEQLIQWGAQIQTQKDPTGGSGEVMISTDGRWRGGDQGLRLLASVDGLWKLRLAGKISDAGLRHLAEVPNLRSLDLHLPGVTDAGVAHLGALTDLRRLNLTYTKTTDAGLEPLAGLKNLQWLGLIYTRVTKAGVAKLQRALPDTVIEGDFSGAGNEGKRMSEEG
ncbi:MAG: hypothetical protein AAF481_05340 [Acidobacteriota bacterium]